MPLSKGCKCNNPAGRKPGSKNKISLELKERIKGFLDDNFTTVTKSFKNLDDKEKLLIYEKLLSYVVPKQKEDNVNISISKLSDEEVDQLLIRLIQNK